MDTRSGNANIVKRNLFARIFLACLWLLILHFVSNVLIGGVVGFFAGMGAGSFAAGKIEGQRAAILVFQQYGLFILIGQLIVFTLLAFTGKLPGTTKFKKNKKPKGVKTSTLNNNRPRALSPSSADGSFSVKKAIICVCAAICISILSGVAVYSIDKISDNKKLDGLVSKPYKVESEWIIHSILTDIAMMGCYARYSFEFSLDEIEISFEKLPSVNSYAVRATIKLPGIPEVYQSIVSIDEGQHIWSPEIYTNFVRNTLKALSISADSTAASQSTETYILQTLLNPDMETLQRENKRLSKQLASDMTNAVHHSEAALLIGMFSLREVAGHFSDTRFGLNRMTAHLAFANALDPSNGMDRLNHFSKITQYLLLSEQKKALSHIDDKFKKDSDLSSPHVDVSWKNALKTRATNDWRILENKKSLSLFEKMEYYRACCTSVTADYAADRIKADENNQIPFIEASRVAATEGVSVAGGHVLLKNSIPTEIQNLQQSTRSRGYLEDSSHIATF